MCLCVSLCVCVFALVFGCGVNVSFGPSTHAVQSQTHPITVKHSLPLVVHNRTDVVYGNILGLNSVILTRPPLITCMFMNMPLSLHMFLCFSCLVLSAHSNGFWCVPNALSLGLRLWCGQVALPSLAQVIIPVLLFSSLISSLQNADKLYKGQLSEFTPMASLHAPRNKRAEPQNLNPRRSEPFTKKLMFTQWRRKPNYCTFTPLIRFTGSSRLSRAGYAYNGAGPETSV